MVCTCGPWYVVHKHMHSVVAMRVQGFHTDMGWTTGGLRWQDMVCAGNYPAMFMASEQIMVPRWQAGVHECVGVGTCVHCVYPHGHCMGAHSQQAASHMCSPMRNAPEKLQTWVCICIHTCLYTQFMCILMCTLTNICVGTCNQGVGGMHGHPVDSPGDKLRSSTGGASSWTCLIWRLRTSI